MILIVGSIVFSGVALAGDRPTRAPDGGVRGPAPAPLQVSPSCPLRLPVATGTGSPSWLTTTMFRRQSAGTGCWISWAACCPCSLLRPFPAVRGPGAASTAAGSRNGPSPLGRRFSPRRSAAPSRRYCAWAPRPVPARSRSRSNSPAVCAPVPTDTSSTPTVPGTRPGVSPPTRFRSPAASCPGIAPWRRCVASWTTTPARRHPAKPRRGTS